MNNQVLLNRVILPTLYSALVVAFTGGVIAYFFPKMSLTLFLCLVTVSLLLFTGLVHLYFHRPSYRGKHYRNIIEGFGDPNRIYLLTDKYHNVIFASQAVQKLFPDILAKGISTFEDNIDGEDSLKNYKTLLANAGKDKNKLTYNLRFKTRYLQFSLYEFLGENVFFWRIENLLPERTNDSFLKGNEFIDRLNVEDILDYGPAGLVIVDDKLLVKGYNRIFKESFLKAQPLQIETPLASLLPQEKQVSFNQALTKVIDETAEHAHLEVQFSWEEEASAIIYASLIKQASLPTKGLFIQFFDNYEQKQLQLQLMQSQKLQALGQLAGGIAHDFNNLLTAMIGFCDLLLSRHFPGDQSFTDIMQIKQNANRAANLVRQLLAFSRQQALQPKILDISDTLSNLSVLLQRLIGVSISLRIVHGRDLGLVRVDQGQFERVIINLIVNARDAIKENGEIAVCTSNKHLDHPLQSGHEVIPKGDYVVVEVIDNGDGISPEHVNKVFDPFFSTKEMGSGTGLGLSTVYGIIKQTDGYIFAESEPGKGTKFTIYLPRYSETVEKVTSTNMDPELPTQFHRDLTGAGTILLVEDEDAVRLFSSRALRDKGYEIIEASTGEEGLSILQEHKKSKSLNIDLMITDIVMPNMDGPTLANKALSLYPNLKIIFISGYAEDSFRKKLRQEGDIHFLAKPFNLKDLAKKVKEVMELKDDDSEDRGKLLKKAASDSPS